LPLQVQHGAALVGVEKQKQAAVSRIGDVVEKRSVAAHEIAARGLDFDDVGAQVGEQFRCKRRRDTLAVLDHPDRG
jgi:hypothetical protein